MGLLRLRSSKTCCLQTGDQESQSYKFQLSPKAWEPGELMVYVPVLGQKHKAKQNKTKHTNLSDHAVRQKKEQFLPSFTFTFCSIQTLSGLDDAPCQPWTGQPALLSLLVETLMSSWNTSTDMLRNNVYPNLWALCNLVKFPHKINHHTLYVLMSPQFIP